MLLSPLVNTKKHDCWITSFLNMNAKGFEIHSPLTSIRERDRGTESQKDRQRDRRKEGSRQREEKNKFLNSHLFQG